MAAAKILGNYTDNDIELCRTTNQRASNKLIQALVEEHIPFTKNSKKIPFFKRMKYKGATEMLVIMINPQRYWQARRVVNEIDRIYRRRLVLSNY